MTLKSARTIPTALENAVCKPVFHTVLDKSGKQKTETKSNKTAQTDRCRVAETPRAVSHAKKNRLKHTSNRSGRSSASWKKHKTICINIELVFSPSPTDSPPTNRLRSRPFCSIIALTLTSTRNSRGSVGLTVRLEEYSLFMSFKYAPLVMAFSAPP